MDEDPPPPHYIGTYSIGLLLASMKYIAGSRLSRIHISIHFHLFSRNKGRSPEHKVIKALVSGRRHNWGKVGESTEQ